MTCSHFIRTSAFLDGELDAAASAEAESHIETCAECQAFVEAAAAASDALRRPVMRHAAPELLRARIARDLDAEARVMARPHRALGFWKGMASGAVATGLAAAAALVLVMPPQPRTLTAALADAHVAALESGHLTDAPFTTHHTLKPWFAGKAPLSPPVVDFSAEGYPLLGGRVDTVMGTKTAVLAYRHGAHQIGLFVWIDRGGALPATTERHGYKLMFWKMGDLDFAAVSDAQTAELDQFAKLVKAVRE